MYINYVTTYLGQSLSTDKKEQQLEYTLRSNVEGRMLIHKFHTIFRLVVPGGAGGAMAPPDFGLNLSQPSRGSDYAQQILLAPPGFSDLLTALIIVMQPLLLSEQLSRSH